jgi:hypothetical protein
VYISVDEGTRQRRGLKSRDGVCCACPALQAILEDIADRVDCVR